MVAGGFATIGVAAIVVVAIIVAAILATMVIVTIACCVAPVPATVCVAFTARTLLRSCALACF